MRRSRARATNIPRRASARGTCPLATWFESSTSLQRKAHVAARRELLQSDLDWARGGARELEACPALASAAAVRTQGSSVFAHGDLDLWKLGITLEEIREAN